MPSGRGGLSDEAVAALNDFPMHNKNHQDIDAILLVTMFVIPLHAFCALAALEQNKHAPGVTRSMLFLWLAQEILLRSKLLYLDPHPSSTRPRAAMSCILRALLLFQSLRHPSSSVGVET